MINQVRLVVAQLPTQFIVQFEAKISKIAWFTPVFGPITGIFGWKVYYIYLKFKYLDELREFVTTKSKKQYLMQVETYLVAYFPQKAFFTTCFDP